MSSQIDLVADQLKADEQTRRSLQVLTAKLNDTAIKIIEWTYIDPELKLLYNSLRNSDQNSDDGHRRRIIKFPNLYVFNFLDDLFTPKYGRNWLSDKNTLRKVMINEQELIMPWVVGRL